MQDFRTLRPFNINDAPTILSWCKDKPSALKCYQSVGFKKC